MIVGSNHPSISTRQPQHTASPTTSCASVPVDMPYTGKRSSPLKYSDVVVRSLSSWNVKGESLGSVLLLELGKRAIKGACHTASAPVQSPYRLSGQGSWKVMLAVAGSIASMTAWEGREMCWCWRLRSNFQVPSWHEWTTASITQLSPVFNHLKLHPLTLCRSISVPRRPWPPLVIMSCPIKRYCLPKKSRASAGCNVRRRTSALGNAIGPIRSQ